MKLLIFDCAVCLLLAVIFFCYASRNHGSYFDRATNSVTRFGEISPLWHDVVFFGHFERVHLVFGKNFDLTLVNVIFIV